jgi:F1F0 ATPase subunit 2
MPFKTTKVIAMYDVLSLVAGVLLGAIFFGGLWWTVRKGMSSERPALWFFGSLMLRMSIALLGFFIVGGGDWTRWLFCLLGFVLARIAVQWLTRQSGEGRTRSAPEAGYAP